MASSLAFIIFPMKFPISNGLALSQWLIAGGSSTLLVEFIGGATAIEDGCVLCSDGVVETGSRLQAKFCRVENKTYF